MGVSTDGQICFGVAFPEGFEFPWDKTADGDYERWWRGQLGYKPPFELYGPDGEYIAGQKPSDARVTEYFKHKRDFDEANPLPVRVVNYCSGECPMYILAILEPFLKNSRGFPIGFDPSTLRVTEDQVGKLKAFIETYVEVEKDALEYFDGDKTLTPKWYLSSYWG